MFGTRPLQYQLFQNANYFYYNMMGNHLMRQADARARLSARAQAPELRYCRVPCHSSAIVFTVSREGRLLICRRMCGLTLLSETNPLSEIYFL